MNVTDVRQTDRQTDDSPRYGKMHRYRRNRLPGTLQEAILPNSNINKHQIICQYANLLINAAPSESEESFCNFWLRA